MTSAFSTALKKSLQKFDADQQNLPKKREKLKRLQLENEKAQNLRWDEILENKERQLGTVNTKLSEIKMRQNEIKRGAPENKTIEPFFDLFQKYRIRLERDIEWLKEKQYGEYKKALQIRIQKYEISISRLESKTDMIDFLLVSAPLAQQDLEISGLENPKPWCWDENSTTSPPFHIIDEERKRTRLCAAKPLNPPKKTKGSE